MVRKPYIVSCQPPMHAVEKHQDVLSDTEHSLKKDYPPCMREQLGARLPPFTPAEFALLADAETDFYGMNYYTAQFARHRDESPSDTDYLGNVDELQQNKEGTPVGEESGLGWLRSCPDLFRKHLTRVYRRYGKPIYITENGCPCPGEDQMTCEEAVDDSYRIRYFDSHLDSICRSIGEDGTVIKGYFAWALLDNLGMFIVLLLLFSAIVSLAGPFIKGTHH